MPQKATRLTPATPEKRNSESLSALKRVDPRVTEVVATATHTTLYNFAESEWQRQNIEGPLFVVKRSKAPTYRLIVLNRLSIENLVEDLDATFEIEIVEGGYLIFRRIGIPGEPVTINGMWFHDAAEHVSISALVKQVIEDVRSAPPPAHPQQPQSQDALLSMLGLGASLGTDEDDDLRTDVPPGLLRGAGGGGLLTPANAPPVAPPAVDLETLRAALRELVEDDAFVAELHRRYLAKATAAAYY